MSVLSWVWWYILNVYTPEAEVDAGRSLEFRATLIYRVSSGQPVSKRQNLLSYKERKITCFRK